MLEDESISFSWVMSLKNLLSIRIIWRWCVMDLMYGSKPCSWESGSRWHCFYCKRLRKVHGCVGKWEAGQITRKILQGTCLFHELSMSSSKSTWINTGKINPNQKHSMELWKELMGCWNLKIIFLPFTVICCGSFSSSTILPIWH